MQTIIVDMTPGYRMPTIHFSQGDVGTQFAIDLRSRFGDSLPASPTVTIQATKPSGFGFTVTATSVTNGVAVFTTTAEMTDEAGRFPAEIKVVKDNMTLFSANFGMEGEANTHPEGTIDGSQETVIPELTQLVERVEDAASSVLDMTVEAETLAAGSQATYSYDEDTNTATFGIPQGEAGAGAAGVTASAYSASKTYAVGDYVIHNSTLYRCTTAITTAESFTAAHWTQVVLADDVCDLKSDIGDLRAPVNLMDSWNVVLETRIAGDGSDYADGNYFTSGYIRVEAGKTYRKNSPVIDAYHRMATYDSDLNPIRVISDSNTVTINAGESLARLCGLQTELNSTVFYNEVTLKTTVGTSKAIENNTGHIDDINNFISRAETIDTDSWNWQSNFGLVANPTDRKYGSISASGLLSTCGQVSINDNAHAIKCTVPTYTSGTNFGFVFYDANQVAIEGHLINVTGEYSSEERVFWIPDNAKSFRTCWYNNTETYGEFKAYYYFNEISELTEKTTLGKIDNIAFTPSKGIIADSTSYDFGKLANSGVIKSSDFILTGNCSCIIANMPYYQSDTTFGFVFYDKNKQPMVGYTFNNHGSYGIETRKFVVPIGATYFRCSEFMDTQTYGEASYYRAFERTSKPYVFVCASNSSELDKLSADYICDGTNDEFEIQSAINSATGKVILAVGDYYIDAFPHTEGNGIVSALHFGAISQQNIIVEGAGYGASRKYGTGNEFIGGATIHVTSECYNSLSSNTQYAIFASVCGENSSRWYPWTKVDIRNIAFMIPDNQKKIICIDGWMMSALSFSNIYAMAVADSSNLKVPVEGCIGIRGLQGSNFGINNRWESSFVWGFYEGYAVSGEHVVGVDLGSRFCNYGFTFNRKSNAVGAWIHPITMINCCDECNFNLPVFGNSGESGKSDGLSGRQTIDLIDYNLEWLSQYSALGGNLATELNAGQTYGSITFTCQPSYGGNSKNDVSAQFWADGYGHNMRTVNMAHAESGTSAERATYYPQYMQKYFDTTLNKLLIYNGSNWVDTMGNLLT